MANQFTDLSRQFFTVKIDACPQATFEIRGGNIEPRYTAYGGLLGHYVALELEQKMRG